MVRPPAAGHDAADGGALATAHGADQLAGPLHLLGHPNQPVLCPMRGGLLRSTAARRTPFHCCLQSLRGKERKPAAREGGARVLLPADTLGPGGNGRPPAACSTPRRTAAACCTARTALTPGWKTLGAQTAHCWCTASAKAPVGVVKRSRGPSEACQPTPLPQKAHSSAAAEGLQARAWRAGWEWGACRAPWEHLGTKLPHCWPAAYEPCAAQRVGHALSRPVAPIRLPLPAALPQQERRTALPRSLSGPLAHRCTPEGIPWRPWLPAFPCCHLAAGCWVAPRCRRRPAAGTEADCDGHPQWLGVIVACPNLETASAGPTWVACSITRGRASSDHCRRRAAVLQPHAPQPRLG